MTAEIYAIPRKNLDGIFRQTLDATPELFDIAQKIERYCERFAEA